MVTGVLGVAVVTVQEVRHVSLDWYPGENLKQSCPAKDFDGGYRDDREQWPAIQDRMIRAIVCMEKAVRPLLPGLRQLVTELEVGGDPDSGHHEAGDRHGC